MATAIGTWNPTPTSFTLVRPCADSDSATDPPTFVEPIKAVSSAPEPDVDESKRFRPLRLFATGGQGLVYVAHDQQLGREVALKELKPRSADRKITRHRFIREAEITGSLEHPGIVPVYALGVHADGRPYYAMRLIQGRTLHDAVQHYYGGDLKVSPLERNLLFRKLLQRFVSVCQTVAYAHSRGIIHRDLKPANVLLGQYGEALVADWGLARPFHPTDGCGSDPEFPIEPDPGDPPSNTTLMGSALGTPAYMSPEQSEGQWDRVGPPSDVYSLGGTLFTILTGQSPLPKLAWSDAHRRITTGDIPSPLQINPNAPRGLVAICRKAMALKPEDRYQSALALSEDIEHWLADEAVSAEPEPLLERAGRWIRRHRTLVWAMGVLWVTAAVALGIGLVLENGWRRSNEIAHQQTLSALDQTQSQLVDDWLGQQRELTAQHKQFLETTLRGYEKVAAVTGQDPATRLAVVRAYRRVGEIRQRLGEQAAAISAIAEADRRISDLSDSKESRAELARLRRVQGLIAKADKRIEVAELYFAEALKLFEGLASEDKNDISLKRELAAAYNNRAVALAQLKRGTEAISAFQSALTLRREIAAESSAADANEAARELASGFANLGQCQRQMGQADLAESHLKQAAEVAQQLVAREPGDPRYHEELASAAQKLGKLHWDKLDKRHYDAKIGDEAKHWLSLACEYFDKLVSRYPGVPDYRLELACALNNIGSIEMHNRRDAEAAIPHYERAVAAIKPLTEKEGVIRCSFIIGAAYEGRAGALAQAGHHREAINAFAEAATVAPEQADLYRIHEALQRIYCNQPAEAIELMERVARDSKFIGDVGYNAACVYAQLSSMKPDVTESFKIKSLDRLKAIAEQGYFKDAKHIMHMDSDSDLKSIRDWPAFQSFRRDLDNDK